MAPEEVSPHTLEENSFPRILLTTTGKGLVQELTKCEDCVRVATYTDTVVKTQCTYTSSPHQDRQRGVQRLRAMSSFILTALTSRLDSPLSPGGLFINLSTFLPVSLDALPLDCLLKTTARNSVNSPAAVARPGSPEQQQEQQRQSGRQTDENSSSKNSGGETASSEKGSSNGSAAGALMILEPQQRLYVHIQSSVDRDQALSLGSALVSGNKKDSAGEEDAAARPSAAGEEGVGKTTGGAAAACPPAAKVAQQQLGASTKLALGIEGGFAVEEECSSGDACPAALSRTFQYCLAVLPQQLRLRPAVLPCAAAGGGSVAAASAEAATTPLSLYSRCMACCCSSSDNESSTSGSGEILQLLPAQEAWERQLLQQIIFLPLDSPDIPEKIRTACNAIVEHRGSSAPTAAATAGGAVAWEEEVKVSKYAATLEQISNPPAIGPTGWRCVDCGAVSNLWLNLSDGYIGCGRRLYGVGGGCLDGREGAAIRHYLDTGKKYPLIVKLGTITPHSADVYSYAADEDCCVIDPLLPQHLSHFGVNIQQLSKTEKSTNEIALDWNVQHEWSRATEADTQLRACSGADFVGLRNMGNSCYINSVVQVLTSIPELREKYVSLFPVLLASLPLSKDSSSEKTGFAAVDFLLQHSSLAVALHTSRYPLQDRRRKAAIIDQAKKIFCAAHTQKTLLQSVCSESIDDTNGAFKSVAYLDADSVTPQLYRHLVGTQHSEFATLHQQDAEEFLSLLLQWLGCRDAEARERLLEAKRRVQLTEAVLKQQQQEAEGETIGLVAAAGCTAIDTMRAEKALEKSSLEKLFSFAVEQRIQCSVTQQVRYSYTRQQVLALPVPMDPAIQERFEEQQQLLQQQQRKKRQRSSGDELREDEAAAAEGGQQKAAAAATAAFEKQETETDEAPSLPSYTFSECIAAFLAPTLLSDYHSSATGKKGEAVKQMRLASFPPYLVVQLKRFFADQHWQAKKLYCPVLVSEELDVHNMRGCGLQEGEVELPEDEGLGAKQPRDQAAGGGASVKSSIMQFDPELLIQLTSMGFTENACKRACLAVQSSSPDACVEWIMTHLNDDDLNDPLPSHDTSTAWPAASANGEAAADSSAEAVVATLTSMGFTEKQARAGLLAVRSAAGGSNAAAACDRAADWLLNHSDNLDAAVETVLKEAEEKKEAEQKLRLQHETATQEATREEAESNIPPLQKIMKGLDDGSSQYTLHAFITHIGKNASCGHYVGHVKRGNKWILFNDEKVAEAVSPPIDLGYIYVFKRKDLL